MMMEYKNTKVVHVRDLAGELGIAGRFTPKKKQTNNKDLIKVREIEEILN